MTKEEAIFEIKKQIGLELINVLKKMELLENEFPKETLSAALAIEKALNYLLDNDVKKGETKTGEILN
jgi:hypothetical protein